MGFNHHNLPPSGLVTERIPAHLPLSIYLQERDLGDEYGWKQIHGDVFRSPDHPLVFSSLIGAGVHIITAVISVVMFVMIGDLYTE